MTFAAALLYWIIVAAWAAVLITVATAFIRNPITFGATRLLVMVVLVGIVRNVIETFYFGLYFGAPYGLFPVELTDIFGQPSLLILPKLIDIAAACLVLGLLGRGWFPALIEERNTTDHVLGETSSALAKEIQERQRLFETSLDLILVTDPQGTFTSVSPSALDILGYRPDEMIGRSGTEFVFASDLASTREEMRLARRGQHTRNFETRYLHKDGHLVDMVWSGVWSEPEARHFFIGRDISEQKAAEAKLLHLAHFDQLTGLPNRSSLQIDLGSLLGDDSTAPASPVALALFDLDAFKDINDTLGHSAGDKLLREVANRLTALVDRSRRIYRLGGDEFVLIVPNCGDPLVVSELVASILNRLGDAFENNGQQLFVRASAGVVVAPNHGSSIDELLSNADLALYDAKAAGGGAVRLYAPHLRARAQARHQLGTELRRAYANNEFVLHFQPQVSALDGAIIGAEALLRWQHPQRGLLAPGAFVEALAESSVVLEVGRWILVNACQTAASWRSQGFPLLRVAVNLFAAQFRRATLLDDVAFALNESGLPPDALELEITENIALGNDDTLLKTLQNLRDQGISLAFDDFGTGYASLSYLARFPFSRIKIDRGFVHKLSDAARAEDTAIVRSIITMAHNLGLKVTAEGVETTSQAAFLRTKRCDEIQGFLYAKPMPGEDFMEMLRSKAREAKSGQSARSHRAPGP